MPVNALDLILWRHAHAADARDGEDDLKRALTPKGRRQATRMAQWLEHELPAKTRILVSPAQRAQETALALDRKFVTEPLLSPGASMQDLLAAVSWPNAKGSVVVVGHQPTLGLAASLVVAGVCQPWSLRKGAVWWVRRNVSGIHVVTVRAPDNV